MCVVFVASCRPCARGRSARMGRVRPATPCAAACWCHFPLGTGSKGRIATRPCTSRRSMPRQSRRWRRYKASRPMLDLQKKNDTIYLNLNFEFKVFYFVYRKFYQKYQLQWQLFPLTRLFCAGNCQLQSTWRSRRPISTAQ